MLNSPPRLKRMLLHPETGREPLFRILKDHGFRWEGLNSNEETARAALDSLEESGFLPDLITRLVKKRLAPYEGYLCFKLDWLLGKNITAVDGEKFDIRMEVKSLKPAVINGINSGPGRISDHLPIYADVEFPVQGSQFPVRNLSESLTGL
jgi:hypothetical protein